MANDIFDELLAPTPTSQPLAPELIQALRRQRQMGQIASLSGDKNIARLGGAEYDSSMKSATDLRDQRAQGAKADEDRAFVKWQQDQKVLDRADLKAYRAGMLKNAAAMAAARQTAANNKPPAQTAFTKTYEQSLARDASQWDQTGKTQAEADLNNLKGVEADLANIDTEIGKSKTAWAPEAVRAWTDPTGLDVQRKVNKVTVENLRNTFGAQFTEKEGASFKALDYDPALSDEQNLVNVRGKIAIINGLIAKKNALFDQYRTDDLPAYQPPDGQTSIETASDAELLKLIMAGE